jgi:hypothetical protein
MRRTLRRLALVVVLAGILLSVSSVGALSALDADRALTIGVPADQSLANLGVESNGDIGTIRGDSGAVEAGTLSNNVGQSLTVLETGLVNDGGTLTVASPTVGSSIASGGSDAVTVQCSSSTSVGQRTVRVDTRVQGTSVEVQNASFSFSTDIQCQKGGGSGAVAFQASDLAPSASSQTFSFDAGALKNKQAAYIDLSGPQTNGGVDYTGGTVSVTSGPAGRSVSYDEATDRIVYEAQGNPSGTVTIEISGIAVTGADGDYYTVSYSDDAGRSDSDVFFISG